MGAMEGTVQEGCIPTWREVVFVTTFLSQMFPKYFIGQIYINQKKFTPHYPRTLVLCKYKAKVAMGAMEGTVHEGSIPTWMEVALSQLFLVLSFPNFFLERFI